MMSFREKQPVWFAVMWIVIYVLAVNVGDALSAVVGVANIVTAPLLIVLSVALFLFVRHNGWLEHYGIRLPSLSGTKIAWYYAPLAIIIAVLVVLGANSALGVTGTALVVLLMLGVGFLEELLFRGLLFKAILQRSGLTRAVVISGVTFGIGHLVNLLRGYTGGEQVLQIVAGIALGIVLALLFAVTGSILPGALFHVLLNIGGTVTQRDLSGDATAVLVMLLLSVVYGTHLWRRTRSQRASTAGASNKLTPAT